MSARVVIVNCVDRMKPSQSAQLANSHAPSPKPHSQALQSLKQFHTATHRKNLGMRLATPV